LQTLKIYVPDGIFALKAVPANPVILPSPNAVYGITSDVGPGEPTIL
jgi:hypothetical protein